MLLNLKKKLTAWNKPAGASLTVFPNDTFIVSYPRSGNTWMRFIIGELIHKHEINFQNLEKLVPDIYRCTNRQLKSVQQPRYIKSHEPYDPRYPKVVYILRDPRDVAISFYNWQIKYNRTTKTFEQFIDDFVTNRTRFSGWGNHVQSWYKNRALIPGGIIFIRYEDMQENPRGQMEELSKFLGCNIANETISGILNHNSFISMQEKEERAADTGMFTGSRQDIKFIRRGMIGQWKNELSPDQNQRFIDSFDEIARIFDYDLYNT